MSEISAPTKRTDIFFRKHSFLSPTSTGHTSYILTEVESSRGGEYKWGTCMVTIADCRRRIQLEFFHLLIEVLTRFRDALLKEKELIEQFQQAERNKRRKTKDSRIEKGN